MTLGCDASVVEPASTRPTDVHSAAKQTNKPIHDALSGHAVNHATPTLRTNMLSTFLCCCQRLSLTA